MPDYMTEYFKLMEQIFLHELYECFLEENED